MALPPGKNIPGADKVGKVTDSLSQHADDAARKAADAAAAAKASVSNTANTAKAAVSRPATPPAIPSATNTTNTVQPGNTGTGGRPGGSSTPPTLNIGATENVQLPPPLPASGTTTGSSVATSGTRPTTTGNISDTRQAVSDTRISDTRQSGQARPPQSARPQPGAPRPPGARPGPRGAGRPGPGRPGPRPAPGRRPEYRDSRPRRGMAPPPGRGRHAAPPPRGPRYVVPAKETAKAGAWAPLLAGILLLGGVLWYAVKEYAPMIDKDLTARSNSALSEVGLDTASVEIDGRNAVLNGSVMSQADSDRAEQVVAETDGVRSVDNQLTIGGEGTAGVERTQPALAFASNDGNVTLSGTVSDQEYATRIETAAKEFYGEDKVSGSISVDANSTNPGWWPAVEQITPDLQTIENGSFDVSNGALVLTGTAPNEQTKADIGAKATELLNGQLTVDNQITATAAALKPAFATYYNSPDRIALYGSLPTDVASSVAESFAGADKPVESFINASDEFSTPAWAANFGGSMAAMQDIDKGKVKIQSSGDILISGIAASEEAKQSAADQVAALFDGQSITNRIAVKAAPAAAPAPEPAAAFMQPFATVIDTGSEVKIVGLLPTAATESLTKAYESAGKTVSTNVTVDDRVIEPDWTSSLAQSTNFMSNIENARVTVSSSGELTISGEAPSENERQAAADQTTAAFGNSVSLRNDITVKGPDISQLFANIDLTAIRFRSNSSELDADSTGILNQVADALSQVPNAQVAISGHTDSTGKDERNLVLSAERAERVRSFLIERGISGDRMTSQGFGSTQPIASNKTVTGRALNRRIEFGLTN